MAFKKRKRKLKTILNDLPSLEKRNRMIENNIRLVYRFVGDFLKTHNGLEEEELISAGYVGLIEAAEHYREDMGIAFSTYCAYWIHDAFSKELASKNTIYLPPTVLRYVARINDAIRKWKAENDNAAQNTDKAEMPKDSAADKNDEKFNTGSIDQELDYGKLYTKPDEDKNDKDNPADYAFSGSTAGSGSEPGDEEVSRLLPDLKLTPKQIHDLRQIPWVNSLEDLCVQGSDDSPREYPLPDLNNKTPEEVAIEDEKQKSIYNTLLKLEERERIVMCCRFGLMGYREQTLQEIGAQLQCSTERVRQIQNKALQHLKELIEKR